MRVSSVLAAAAALIAAVSRVGRDLSIGFYKLTNNGNPNVASQLSVEVIDATDGGGAKTAFKFYNAVGTASSDHGRLFRRWHAIGHCCDYQFHRCRL
jgi:hypothetical protein